MTYLGDFGTWSIRYPWAILGATVVMAVGFWSFRRPSGQLAAALLIAGAAVTSLCLWHFGHAMGDEIRLMRAGLPPESGLLQWAAKSSFGPVIWPTRAGLVGLGCVLLTLALRRRKWIALCSVPILVGALIGLG